MVEKVKIIRVSIDGLIQVADKHLENWTDPVKKATDSLSLAKMWLGKALGSMGDSNPYPEGNNPANDAVEPLADTATEAVVFEGIDMNNQIAVAKKIRLEISVLLADLGGSFSFNNTSTDLGTFVNCSRLAMVEAGMWLGMYLRKVNDIQERQEKQAAEHGQEMYEGYVNAIKPKLTPGDKFPVWVDLSDPQRESWIEISKNAGYFTDKTTKSSKS